MPEGKHPSERYSFLDEGPLSAAEERSAGELIQARFDGLCDRLIPSRSLKNSRSRIPGGRSPMNRDARTIHLLARLARNDGVTTRLGLGRVAIVLSPKQAEDPHAQLLTTFATNPLARLYPVVHRRGRGP